jgi:hypothetical protein
MQFKPVEKCPMKNIKGHFGIAIPSFIRTNDFLLGETYQTACRPIVATRVECGTPLPAMTGMTRAVAYQPNPGTEQLLLGLIFTSGLILPCSSFFTPIELTPYVL